MMFGSLFTGVGGFDDGFEQAGHKCVWQVENDGACNSVLARHWPQVKRIGDVRDVTTDGLIRPDAICGGFPCQDLSVAGRRAGLAGERSGLFFEFMRIVGVFTPGTVIIENVPGLLSSSERRDMGIVLGALGQLGYGFAYRVFDAQYFRVAQRRRRVFIVGCLGDWRRAAEILFERESLPWHPAPRRETGTRVAASLTRGADSSGKSGYDGRRREDDVNLALCLNGKNGKRYDGESDSFVAYRTSGNCGVMEQGDRTAALNCATDPNQQIITTAYAIQERAVSENENNGPQGKGWQEGVAFTLEARHHQQAVVTASVRRLMPIECERLQGFRDDHTRWAADGSEISDSPRYRMIGNAVAVPVAKWIGKRLR